MTEPNRRQTLKEGKSDVYLDLFQRVSSFAPVRSFPLASIVLDETVTSRKWLA